MKKIIIGGMGLFLVALLLQGSSIVSYPQANNFQGILGLSNGGTGSDLSSTGGTSQVLKQVSSGALVTVARLACSDLSNSSASCSTDATNASNLSSGTVGVTRGGTGLNSGTSGGILAFTATNAISSSSALTLNQLIVGGGAGAAPSTLAAGSQFQSLVMGASAPGYGQVNLAQSAAVTGTLGVGNGGTGLGSGTSGGILGYTASGTLASSGALTANQLIVGGGAGVTPSTLAAGSQYQALVMGASAPGYGQLNLAQSAAVTGTLGVSNGGTGVTSSSGSGNVVLSNSPTIVTPTITTSITSPAFVSSTANPSTAGVLECANNELCIGFRNAANSSNGTLKLDASNNIAFGGSLNGMDFGGSILKGVTTFNASSTITLTGVTTGTNADFLCMTSGGVVTLQGSACTISSKRFKENIRLLTERDGLSQVMKLRPVEFNMILGRKPNKDINYTRTQTGLIAEDVAQVDTRLAIYEQDGVTPKSYRQEAVIAILIKAMQEQQAQIYDLKKEIQTLKLAN